MQFLNKIILPISNLTHHSEKAHRKVTNFFLYKKKQRKKGKENFISRKLNFYCRFELLFEFLIIFRFGIRELNFFFFRTIAL